jgi:hypothetical protein
MSAKTAVRGKSAVAASESVAAAALRSQRHRCRKNQEKRNGRHAPHIHIIGLIHPLNATIVNARIVNARIATGGWLALLR